LVDDVGALQDLLGRRIADVAALNVGQFGALGLCSDSNWRGLLSPA